MLLGSEAVQVAAQPDSTVPTVPSLREQSNTLRDEHICFDTFLQLVVEGYAADPDFCNHTHLLTQVGQYWFKDYALALPDHADLRNSAIFQMHDSPWSAHVGRTRTLAIIRNTYGGLPLTMMFARTLPHVTSVRETKHTTQLNKTLWFRSQPQNGRVKLLGWTS